METTTMRVRVRPGAFTPTTREIPTIRPATQSDKLMTVHCGNPKCDHEWRLSVVMPISVRKLTPLLDGVVAGGCPKCGQRNRDTVRCGPRPRG
jgi:hypothetical protein